MDIITREDLVDEYDSNSYAMEEWSDKKVENYVKTNYIQTSKVADSLEDIDSKLSVIASKNKQDKIMKQALRYEIKELISILRGNGK